MPFQDREKISSIYPDKKSDKSLVERNVKSIIKDSEYIGKHHLLINRGHWANRDFSEYRKVA